VKQINPRAIELFGDKPPSPTGTEYLPEEAVERAKKGSFVEKVRASPHHCHSLTALMSLFPPLPLLPPEALTPLLL
jgi:hypothetical protein